MNNELFQMCCYVSAVKHNMISKKNIDFIDNTQHIESITFKFLPRKKFFRNYNLVAHNFYEWQKYLKQEGLVAIKLYTPIGEAFKKRLFACNTQNSFIACFYKNGFSSQFCPYWSFNEKIKKWNIVYTENEMEYPTLDFFKYEDNTKNFVKIINDCIAFSQKTNLAEFVSLFQKCLNIIDGKDYSYEREYKMTLPVISEDKLKLFEAGATADVFGGMGSWNDIGFSGSLDKEYQKLSDELFMQYKLAILYTINES